MLAEAQEKKAAALEEQKLQEAENPAEERKEVEPAAIEEKKDGQNDEDSEEEQDPEEEKFIEEARKEIREAFIKVKYDSAIAKFEATGEHAQFIQEFNYRIEGDKKDDGEI